MPKENLILFGILSLPIIFISWRTLFDVRSHGFYRFFSWECITWLFVSNYGFWFYKPFSFQQIFSWIFLFWSIYLVLAGVILLKKSGKPVKYRYDKMLYRFEKTSELVDHGIFRYVRHPLYASLLFLTWGIFLKNTSVPLFIVAVSSTVFLYFTALSDERECMAHFGNRYADYMKKSKRFIPFIF